MSTRTRKWLIGGGIGVVALIALVYGAIFFYANVINDSPDRLDSDDLTAAVNATTAPSASTTDPADDSTTTDTATSTTATTTTETDGNGQGDISGPWTATPESEFGYRVDEVLAGVNTTAVGRSNQIEGTMTIDGSVVSEATFTVDVASIESDDGRRDTQFRGRIMETEQFPTASFTLTEPIDLGSTPQTGEQVETSATGEVELHGVTQTMTFDVTAELGQGGNIGVLGSIPVEFADYDIDNPSFGAVTTEDNGLIEFVLVFSPA